MRRREFIAGLVVLTTIGHARAQHTDRVYRIAIASTAWPVAEMTETGAPHYAIFLRELRRLGYVEG
jgi:hypothetical protein